MTTTAAPPANATNDDIRADVELLSTARAECKASLEERNDEVDIFFRAVVSKTHVVFAGDGGVAKSHLMREAFKRLPGEKFLAHFRKDMDTQETFGPVSIKALENDEFRHNTAGHMPTAHFVAGEEFADGSSTAQRALLLMLNERQFPNGRTLEDVPLMSFFGLTNFLSTDAETAALWDRLACKRIVKAVQADDSWRRVLRGQVDRLANGGQMPGIAVTRIPMESLERLQAAHASVQVPDDILTVIIDLRRKAEQAGIETSVRRYGEGVKLAMAQAILCGRRHVTAADLGVLADVLWTDPDEANTVADLCGSFADATTKEARKLRKMLEPYQEEINEMRGKLAAGESLTGSAASRVVEISGATKGVEEAIEKELTKARKDGRDTSELDMLLAEANAIREFIRKDVLG